MRKPGLRETVSQVQIRERQSQGWNPGLVGCKAHAFCAAAHYTTFREEMEAETCQSQTANCRLTEEATGAQLIHA